MSGVDIDEVMTRTWLIVTMLRHGAAVPEGKILYQRCCGEIERVREVLEKAGYDRISIEHISFAQCALLDEAVLRHHASIQGDNDISGDASPRPEAVPKEWKAVPLQSRYFSTLRAGGTLWQRITEVLHQPAPVEAVLTCYHRVLAFGFQGLYTRKDEDVSQRDAVLKALAARVPPLPSDLSLVVHHRARYRFGWLRSFGFWLVMALLVTGLAWWGGHLWLQSLLTTHLSGFTS